jgi:hypothetical protein
MRARTMSLTPWMKGALFAAFLGAQMQAAHSATPCPPPSIAGSPNSLTTSRPTTGPAATTAKCTKPATPPAPVVAAPSGSAEVPPPAVPESWKTILEPLNAGGWAFISDGPVENPSAVYASTHNILHDGNVVTAWMRWEFSRPQAEVYPLHYLSAVTREELDCDQRTYRRAAVIYYTRNNLQEKGPSFTALDDDTTWKQAIPGTEADAMLSWGCPAPAAKAAITKSAETAKATGAAKAAAQPADSSAPAAAAAAAAGTDLHTAR